MIDKRKCALLYEPSDIHLASFAFPVRPALFSATVPLFVQNSLPRASVCDFPYFQYSQNENTIPFSLHKYMVLYDKSFTLLILLKCLTVDLAPFENTKFLLSMCFDTFHLHRNYIFYLIWYFYLLSRRYYLVWFLDILFVVHFNIGCLNRLIFLIALMLFSWNGSCRHLENLHKKYDQFE